VVVTAASQPYYTRRKVEPADHDAYWRHCVDPDGNTRDRRKERKQYLRDQQAEVAWLQSLQPGRALDIGCGFGWLLSSLPDGWTCVGVEPSEYAAEIASDVAVVMVEQFSDDMFEARQFDLVICHHVIEHLSRPCEAMGEINRITKRGARLLMATPDFASPCAVRFGKNYRMLHDATHCSLFTNESMHRFLRDFGWRIDRVAYPFPDRFATRQTFARWKDVSKVSPPWPGNWMTFYCTKP
jgi:SAM-dependent methyltransferase